jgi:D-alanyl-D-alanine carboxypeptidase
LDHSHFVTVHGKQNENHYTTVRDMAVLTAYALNKSQQSKMFREIVGTKTYVAESGPRALSLVNSNRMLIDMPATEKVPQPISCLYADAIGVKTGDTNAAGKCLVAAAERNGVTLIAVLYGGTLNDPEYNNGWSDGRKDKYNARRFQDAALMFDYAFSDMVKTVSFGELVDAGMPLTFDIRIANASPDDSQGGVLTAKANLSLDTQITLMQPDPTKTTKDFQIDCSTNITSQYAPISEGSAVGTVSYSYRGATIATAELLASRSVKEGTAVTDLSPVTSANTEQSIYDLIGDANVPTVDHQPGSDVKENSGSCASGIPKGVYIVLGVLGVLLLVVVVLFCLYVRAEKKRRAAARRRAARRRAMQERQYDEYSRR